MPINGAYLIGKTFGRLEVLDVAHMGLSRNVRLYVRCICGVRKTVIGVNLLSGKVKSCGCWKREEWLKRVTTHKKSRTFEYRAWVALKARCLNKKTKFYKHYGGRGISVCAKWLKGFEAFFKDMGERPSTKHSLDRINNDKGYSKSNCRWSTHKEQCRNMQRTRYIHWKGKKRCIAEVAELNNIRPDVLRHRLNLGWALYEALITPIRFKRDNRL